MEKVDLHSHSIYSDGEYSPKELLEMARKNHIKYYALTDHDNIVGSKELISIPHDDMTIYSGVELSAKVTQGRMHILGYNFDLEDPQLNSVLANMHDAAIHNMKLYISILKNYFNISLPSFETDNLLNCKSNIGRPQLARLLVKYNYCNNVEEAFQKYLIYAYESIRSTKKGLSKEECLYYIANAKGISSLAHPNSLKLCNEDLEKEVLYLKNHGLKAIEIIHIHNSPSDRVFYQYLADKYDLLTTGGSDFHGENVKPNVLLGRGINNNVDIAPKQLSLTKTIKSRY